MDSEKKRSAKRRSLEAGKEMLARYKASLNKSMDETQVSEASDRESTHNDETEVSFNSTLGQQHTNMLESSFRDTTQSSISASEGETDGDMEIAADRITKLQVRLQGKQAEIESLSAEFENIRAEASSPNSSQSANSSAQYTDEFLIYKAKLCEFEQAIEERDKIIKQLTSDLEQTIIAKDSLKAQLKARNAIPPTNHDVAGPVDIQTRVSTLEKALAEHVKAVKLLNTQLDQSHEYITSLQNEKQTQMEQIDNYKSTINLLNEQVRAGAAHNSMNVSEAEEIQKICGAQVEKIKKTMEGLIQKFAIETESKALEHDQKIKELEDKHQVEMTTLKRNYEEQYNILFERYNTELPAMESKHAKELHVFQSQLSAAKKNYESLKSELENHTKPDQFTTSDIKTLKMQLYQCQQDKKMLQEQIELHKQQLQDITAKCVAATSVLNSKESIEKSLEEALVNLESLKRENENLKFQYDDISARYAASQAVIENNQLLERRMSHRVYELEKSLSRFSGINMSLSSEFNTTSYKTFDEEALQVHVAKQQSEEKDKRESKLVERIHDLEEYVSRIKEELETANMEKRTYEKLLKDTKNKIISESETPKTFNSPPQPFPSSLYFSESSKLDSSDKVSSNSTLMQSNTSTEIDRINMLENEILQLKKVIQQKDQDYAELNNNQHKIMERLKQFKSDRDNLKKGLAMAWGECTEMNTRLDQTLSINESRVDEMSSISHLTIPNTDLIDSFSVSENPDNERNFETYSFINDESKVMSEIPHNFSDLKQKLATLCIFAENVDHDNQRLKEENASLLRMQENLEALRNSLDELNAEKILLVEEIASLTEKRKEQLSTVRNNTIVLSPRSVSRDEPTFKAELEKRHAKEMEELRTYFEEKCLQMEKQYSEEIFSQQSKKVSDDSEIEDLTDDLYYGGGGDCVNANNTSFNNSKREKTLEGDLSENKINEQVHQDKATPLTTINQLCQTEWDADGENGELSELRAAYSHQLEEQVALAKCDIVNALQEQIQALLAVENDTEANWPAELLELRNKFTNNAKREMDRLKEDHMKEIGQLKEEHSRAFARTIERYQQEINKLTAAVASYGEHQPPEALSIDSNVIKQRDNLHKTCATLKGLVNELVKYFANCEEELNNTLISEVLKRQSFSLENQSLSLTVEKDIQEKENSTGPPSPTSPKMKIKRVHFAPTPSQISRMLNKDTALLDLIEEESQISVELRTELEKCLQRMRTESAQIFEISITPGESMLDTLSKQVSWTTKINEELSAKLSEAESTIEDYQVESEQLKLKILDLQQKLIVIDSKKEIISEGYGEQDETGSEIAIQDLTELHEKARLAIMNGAGDNSYLLQLIEELCRYHDKQSEEIRKEKEDLQLQIEAADKQLRGTRKFLEEQASEREIERDDAARQIHSLHEQLKEREREKERDLRITSEQSPSLSPEPSLANSLLQVSEKAATVEALEAQLREMSTIIADLDAKKTAAESELKTAVAKIWELREIIVDHEQQIQAKIENEELLETKIDQLQERISSQTRDQQDLMHEFEVMKLGGEDSLIDHITHLQEELRKQKLCTEHFNVNSPALKQMKSELREMQAHLDKRIKELEAFHMCGSNLSISQPSEDVSIRDQIDATRCPTPDDSNGPPTLPLDQLLKLKEKLLKHTRAEEVAFKRMKDLEMQLSALKMQNEELQAEQEILQQTASDQLFQIEVMRGRLEQQKQSAPFVQRKATSRLEIQLHEANAKLQAFEQIVADKDLELKDVRVQMDRANHLLFAKQQEIANVVQSENNMIQELKDRLDILEQEKGILESKLNTHERAQQIPQLLGSMLADKNEEIDHLKEQMSKKEKQIEALTSLNIDDNQLSKQIEPKNSARTLSDILSIHSECEDVGEAIREASNLTHNAPFNMSSLKAPLGQSLSKDQLDGSTVPFLDIHKPDFQVPLLEFGSQQHSFGSPSHTSQPQISLTSGADNTKSDYYLKSPPVGCSTATEFTSSLPKSKATSRSSAQAKNKKSENEPQTFSTTDPNSPKPRIEDLENQLKAIHQELQAKSATLNKREMELDSLQTSLDELRAEFKDSIDTLTRDNIFYKSQYELSQESESKIKRDLEEVEDYLKVKTEELNVCKEKMKSNERILMEIQSENSLLEESNDKLREENATFKITIREKAQELKNLKDIIFQKDITIETIKTRNQEIENENKQLYEFKTKFENSKKELSDCESEIQRLTDGINHRNEQIQRLEEMARRSSVSGSSSADDKDNVIYHLQECIKEKEKVIREMSDDSKSLHRSLETIRNKMKEAGNVEELRRKLRDERTLNGELITMVAKLKQELEILRDESVRESEGHDIEDMVQRELNLSASLDKKIMDAIESEPEEVAARKIEMHSCNSLTIKPVERDLEKIMQQYTEIRRKLKQANKLNDSLYRQKDELEIERDMLKTQIGEYEERILQIKADLESECRKNSEVCDRVSRAKAKIRELENQLEREKNSGHSAQLQDSELISTLRMKLTSSLEAEEQLRNNLASSREQHKLLQTKLNTLKHQIELGKSVESSMSPVLQNAEVNDLLWAEKYEKAARELVELSDNLKTLEAEKNRYERELEIQFDERESLQSKIALTEGANEHLEADLRRTKEDLKSSEEDCKFLQKRINTMLEAENKRQKSRSDELAEVKHLRVEIRNLKAVMKDLEIDSGELKRQLADSQMDLVTLKRSEGELQSELIAAKVREGRLKDHITELQDDLRIKLKRDFEFSRDYLADDVADKVSNQLIEKIATLKSSIAKYSSDKSVLYDKLIRSREESEKNLMRVKELEAKLLEKDIPAVTGQSMDANAIAKMQHLYAKYKRTDSKKKALAYQKRYLLCVIGGYQLSEDKTLSVLAQLTNVERSYVSEQTLNVVRKTPKACLRSAFLAIVAVIRIKWLVQRWRSGLRKNATNVVTDFDEPCFSGIPRAPINHSPPVRDRRNPLENGSYGNIDYNHYVQRVSNIQQSLGLMLTQPKPNQMPSE